MSEYTYSTSEDFPNGTVATDRLTQEIRDSAITVALDYINTDGDDCIVVFKADLSSGEEDVLDGLVAAHSGEPLPNPTTADGVPIFTTANTQSDDAIKVAVAPREGREITVGSHNLCDPTSWYSESVRVDDQALVDSGDGLTWQFPQGHIIVDMEHGKVLHENCHQWAQKVANPDDPHGYKVIVEVDSGSGWEAKTMRPPFVTDWSEGGDYYITYDPGSPTGYATVTFQADQTGYSVRASYSREDGSAWIFKPPAGHFYDIEAAEAQFTDDIEQNDHVLFDTFMPAIMADAAGVPRIDPSVCSMYDPPHAVSNGGSIPDMDPVLVDRLSFKTIGAFIDEARGAYPVVPALGSGPRGMPRPMYGYPFHYEGAARRLRGDLMMEMHLHLKADKPFGGTRATATLYYLDRDLEEIT